MMEEDGIINRTRAGTADSNDSSIVSSSSFNPTPDHQHQHQYSYDNGDDMNANMNNTNDDNENLMMPLMLNPTEEFDTNSIRSRNRKVQQDSSSSQQQNQQQQHQQNRRLLRRSPNERRYSHVMNFLARLLFWISLLALVAVVIWYSYELKNNGKDPHLIAWFSAGAFVLLGFPISMYGIVMHLANYNQPNIQLYIIRILWMVPIYSMESWLCLRYHQYAIYIETLRDFYESFVLYSFMEFLIQVLGGEEELILMLKDKSPTRGVHMWGMQYCLRPWLMGQPVSRSVIVSSSPLKSSSATTTSSTTATTTAPVTSLAMTSTIAAATNTGNNNHNTKTTTSTTNTTTTSSNKNTVTTTTATTTTNMTTTASSTTTIKNANAKNKKRVQWTSPFFVKCKFGVLQYVLFKFVISFVVMILELNGLYKEGDFTPKRGYLYICFLTNISQCWALYCLIFFYFATVTELSPIRPVGKFLSVKAIVFFTWWQSVCISMVYQADLIPHYSFHGEGQEDEIKWTSEDVAKGMQDYLICIEMFIASLVHFFVFPHTDYLPQAVQLRSAQHLATYTQKFANQRRVGRLHNPVSAYGWLYISSSNNHHHQDDRSKNSNSASGGGGASTSYPYSHTGGGGGLTEEQDYSFELPSVEESNKNITNMGTAVGVVASHVMEIHPQQQQQLQTTSTIRPLPSLPMKSSKPHHDSTREQLVPPPSSIEEGCIIEQQHQQQLPSNKGFLNAFMDATLNTAIPRDILQNSAGIIKGDYVVEKKTLLHHATTSDTYDLFSSATTSNTTTNTPKRNQQRQKTPKEQQ
mmetsp:Transcript_21840/g.24910  ORF Transcript_21840/g.24910 Transcript_21840/m.24910 type:complete len:805 (+) Transcript_21840:818-3232(+)